MEFEKSCGAVIYMENANKYEFLIISHRNDGHWGFPKGHVEKNETEKETALREVFEETGLHVDLHKDFRARAEYLINKDTMKEVIFFVGSIICNEVDIQLSEIREYKWANFQEAELLLSYESSKDVLKEAYNFIINRPII
jgi:bis(5'-nucleosidyl)-tetraphosphatase